MTEEVNVKKIAAAILVIALLSGCASRTRDQASKVEDTPPTQWSVSSEPLDVDGAFWDAVEPELPSYVDRSDAIAIAKGSCDIMIEYGFEAGANLIASIAESNDVSQDVAMTLAAGGAIFYCPEVGNEIARYDG